MLAAPRATAQQEIPADLRVTKSGTPNPVQEGDTVTYTIVVSNVGEGPAEAVVISDSFPFYEHLEITAVESVAPCEIDHGARTIICKLEALAPGEQVTITIRVSVFREGGVLNEASAVSESPEANDFDNEATEFISVTPAPKTNITIDKSGPEQEVLEGEEVTYTIVVRNEGDLEARDVVVTDTFERLDSSIHEATSTSGTCTISGSGLTPNRVECRLDRVPPGGTVTITVRARILGVGVVRNRAVVETSVPETSTVDNEDSAFTPVGPGVHCPIVIEKGSLAPTQGVWQDDPFFADKPGKRLVELSPTSFRAELRMVRERPTLLVGIHHADGRSEPPDREHIVIEGTTTGSVAVPVTMHFSSPGSTLDHMPAPFDTLEVLGPCGEEKSFRIELDAAEGRPDFGAGAFRFTAAGRYTVENELVRADGRRIGDKSITVRGRVVETTAPSIEFVPSRILATTGPEQNNSLSSAAQSLMSEFRQSAPDYWPLRLGAFDATTTRTGVVDMTEFVPGRRLDRRMSFITRVAGMSSVFRNVARQVLVISDSDMTAIFGSNILGSAESKKVVYVRESVFHDTVSHELIHTLPYLWTGFQMRRECDHDFHPDPGEANPASVFRVANGLQITDIGIENRVHHERHAALMGANFGGNWWITQCTFKHLIDQLQQPQDPPVLLVQGEVRKEGARVGGRLESVYQMDGFSDLRRGRGRWKIVLRDGKGKRLARFPFKPYFRSSEGTERSSVGFVFQVPHPSRTRQVVLKGPGGLLARRKFTRHAPSVEITAPSPVTEDETVLTWEGRDLDGDELRYTVLYSGDGGARWELVLFEDVRRSVPLTLAAGGDHVAKVIVTDGARSSEARVSF